MKKSIVLSTLALGAAAYLLGEEGESSGKASLSKVTLGEHWFGPEVDQEELKGRVVLYEFWGFN